MLFKIVLKLNLLFSKSKENLKKMFEDIVDIEGKILKFIFIGYNSILWVENATIFENSPKLIFSYNYKCIETEIVIEEGTKKEK